MYLLAIPIEVGHPNSCDAEARGIVVKTKQSTGLIELIPFLHSAVRRGIRPVWDDCWVWYQKHKGARVQMAWGG